MKTLRSLVLAALLAAASPALAVDRNFSTDAPDLDGIRDKIEAADFRGAIADLNALIDDGVQHADVYNLMGFSLRKSGDTKAAMSFYQKALEYDPDHKGALEYSGELYLQLGDVAKARENEAKLKALCPQGCEELADLQQAIEQAAAKSR
ncbi:tetratricopeptide repeat protein [Inquilinus limosus]|uniref:tetratricopeptide repeat protein n=1 Tax=Inquilinus limosus TaxID=171674 RepID=UPI0003F905E8|nr:tetratricopeptide repeat protein [Inquilinus limosus]